jgi:hypothetical protein
MIQMHYPLGSQDSPLETSHAFTMFDTMKALSSRKIWVSPSASVYERGGGFHTRVPRAAGRITYFPADIARVHVTDS